MPLRTTLEGADGRGLDVDDEGALYAIIHPHPPRAEVEIALPFREFFINGEASDMTVNGAVTNQTFSISANHDHDIYIKTISVAIGDAGSRLNLFGAITALTNGVYFVHIAGDSGTTVLHDGIKTNLEFMRMALGEPSVGDGTTAFRADISGNGADTYLPSIDFYKTFGLPWGVRLRKGSEDRLSFVIRDDVSGIDQFDAIGYGIKF